VTDTGERAWARRTTGGWLLQVRVQPAAGRSAVVGTVGDALKVRVAAPANEGKANAELVRFLADLLGVRLSRVRIVQGDTFRTKLVEVDDPTHAAALPVVEIR
jgi:uncharacterized protein (TIGR00251 family)